MESNILLAVYVIVIFTDYNVMSCNVESIDDRGSRKIFAKKDKTPVIVIRLHLETCSYVSTPTVKDQLQK